MKSFFLAIRKNNIAKVKEYLNKDKNLANCIAKQPPKKDDGQSPLQIAFKIGDLQIAKLLIEFGANINYIDQSKINSWNTPALHDFMRGLIFTINDENRHQEYLSFFRFLIDQKIDFYANDSFGNTSLVRLILDTDQIYQYQHRICWDSKNQFYNLSDAQKNTELENKLKNIYNLFLDNYDIEKLSELDIDVHRSTGIFEEFKIDTFSIELLNSIFKERTGNSLPNFEIKN
jgi:ankyrin repeat protein